MPGELAEGDQTGPFRPFVQIRLVVSTSYDLAIHTCKRAPSSPTNWTPKLSALFMVNSVFFSPLVCMAAVFNAINRLIVGVGI